MKKFNCAKPNTSQMFPLATAKGLWKGDKGVSEGNQSDEMHDTIAPVSSNATLVMPWSTTAHVNLFDDTEFITVSWCHTSVIGEGVGVCGVGGAGGCHPGGTFKDIWTYWMSFVVSVSE